MNELGTVGEQQKKKGGETTDHKNRQRLERLSSVLCIYTSCIILFFPNIKVLFTGWVNVHVKAWIISVRLPSQHFSVRS